MLLLVHLCAPAAWRMALAAGSVAPPSLLSQGFVHLSTPTQVELPANALYAGRDDLVALVIDPVRLPGELRWEPGRPDDPAAMRFPHHYAGLPVASVVAVLPYRPGVDGRFAEPDGLPAPDDVERRVRVFDRSLAERRAAAVVPVEGGVAVLDPRFPASHEHNSLWVTGPSDVAGVAAEAERVLGGAGLGLWRAVVDDAGTASALTDLGWAVEEQRLMVFRGEPPERSAAVVAVAHEVVARMWGRSWRRDVAGTDDETVRQLIAREPVADAVMRIIDLAVLGAGGEPIASTQLRLDGATAAVEAVMTDPEHRRGGLGRALVLDALARAREAGADVVFLSAAADDWPRRWYGRLGFSDVGPRFEATLTPA